MLLLLQQLRAEGRDREEAAPAADMAGSDEVNRNACKVRPPALLLLCLALPAPVSGH